MARGVLVIAPHGLDEALGCGGAMARHADEGDTVHVLVLFGDGTGRDAVRRANARKAAQILGAQPPRFAGFPENRSDTLALLDVVGVIERCAAEVNPDTVYVSHGGNLNIDHQTSCRAALTALRPVPGSSVRALYAYEVLSSTDWAASGEPFIPNRFVEITAQLERKVKALEAYGEEMRPAPHARSMDGVRALARLRGGSAGVSAAEALLLLREIARA
ncbi:MAG TPA: PIG-L deacetylase family protein [Burkholderiales bacterium]|nr:PIG-L deacetylase family protein [Burkholderiales bacterium]